MLPEIDLSRQCGGSELGGGGRGRTGTLAGSSRAQLKFCSGHKYKLESVFVMTGDSSSGASVLLGMAR